MSNAPAVDWMERHEIAFYVGAIAAGVAAGWWIPGAPFLDAAINPVLALLLFATFLAVPFTSIRPQGGSRNTCRNLTARGGRFLADPTLG